MDTDKHRLDKTTEDTEYTDKKNICVNPCKSVVSNIGFPESAYLHKRVPKKQFLESGELVASDKKLLGNQVKNVYWEYTLKPSTCPVLPYRDDEREYLEVAVLQVEMNSQKGHKRIAEIIHRLIPYPLMIGFYIVQEELTAKEAKHTKKEDEENNFRDFSAFRGSNIFALSIAPKRFSQAEQGALVVERFYTTGWMNGEALSAQESAFVASLAWNNLPLQTYGTLYHAWVERFIGYECSQLSGTFTLGQTDDRLERLARCREIEVQISELRGQLKKAAFNRQVELNTQIKQMERELAGMVVKL